MKLFLLTIVAILFISCSQDPANESNAGNDDKSKPIRTIVPEPTPDQDLGPANSVAPVSAEEEDTADLAAAEDTPAVAGTDTDEQGLVALEEVSVTTPVPVEELVPLDLTEDQLLVAQITERYNDYIELQQTWEDHAPQLEILQDQATNQEFLDSISVIQSHMTNTPVTSSQVKDIEETLQEGIFIYDKYREHAEKKHEQLDAFVDLFEASLDLSLQFVELAEEDPSVLYAQTTDEDGEDEQTPELFVPAPEDTVTTVIAMAEEDTQNMPEPLVVAIAEKSIDDPTEDENVEDDDTNTDKETEPANEEASDDTAVAIAEKSIDDPTEDENVEDDDTNTDKETEPANEEASDDTVVAIAEKSKSIDDSTEEDTATDDIADVQPEEEETLFMEDVVAWWDGIVQWFDKTFEASNLSGWVLEPTSLHTPNTSTIVPEAEEEEITEETDSVSEQEAHQLMDELLQNVNQFAQTHHVQSVEDLIPHVIEISNISAIERTAEQAALLSKIKQVAQAIDQMTDGSANDFVEFSGYNSENLPQVEVTAIVAMLSNVVKTDEAQQEPVEDDTLL